MLPSASNHRFKILLSSPSAFQDIQSALKKPERGGYTDFFL
jgi:hypothetical protein